jgi:hypothetical protein
MIRGDEEKRKRKKRKGEKDREKRDRKKQLFIVNEYRRNSR